MRTVAEPALDGADVAIADGALQDVVREAVDLHEDDPGNVGAQCLAALGLPADDLAVVEVVVVDGEEGRGDGVDESEADGNGDARPDAVHLETLDEQGPEIDEHAVAEQRAKAKGQDRDRQCDPDEKRPDKGIEEANRRGSDDGGPPAADMNAGNYQGKCMEPDGRDPPDEQDAQESAAPAEARHSALSRTCLC